MVGRGEWRRWMVGGSDEVVGVRDEQQKYKIEIGAKMFTV